jgi:hypothetical protein
MLGLPAGVRACPGGVLAQAARVHAAAWKEIVDGYRREHAVGTDDPDGARSFTPPPPERLSQLPIHLTFASSIKAEVSHQDVGYRLVHCVPLQATQYNEPLTISGRPNADASDPTDTRPRAEEPR